MANQKIRGVTVEIGGDTTGLQKSLKAVNSSINNTAKQLKDVNNLLKLDPGNTDLLKQKQTLLANEISDVKKKIEEEKAALAQMDQEVGTKGATEGQQALQRDIIASEQQLKELEKQAKQSASVLGTEFQLAGGKISDFGGKVSDLGNKLMPVTGAVAGVAAGSAAAWKEVDSAMDTVVKMTGASGKALEGLEQNVKNIATSIPTSFDNAAQAIGEVNTRFGVTGQVLEDLSTQFIQFAELNGTDIVSSVDAVQKALSAYGLGVEHAGEMLDRLTKVSQDTGVATDKLTSGLVSNGTAFQELGLNMDQAITFMGQLEKSGSNSETVLNGMRKALKNATDAGIPLDQALSDLQDTIVNGTDSMDGLSAAYEMFGKSGDQIYGAVKDGTIDFKELAGAVESAGGTVADTFEATVDPADEFEQTMNEVKLVGADIAETVMPYVAEALERVSEAVKSASEWWSSLDEEQKKTIITIAGVVAAVAPVLVIVGKIITFIGGIVSAVGTITTALAPVGALITGTLIPAIGGAIAAIAPFLPLIALVVGAIVGVIAVVRNWGDISDWLSEKWTIAKEKISETWNSFKDSASSAFNAAKDTITSVFTSIYSASPDWAKKLIDGYLNIIKFKIELIKKIFNDVKEKGIKQTFIDLIAEAKTWAKDMMDGFIQGIKDKIQHLKDTVLSVANTISSYLHFSVPDVGPLHKADTWMPDMMELLSDTMENSLNILDPALNATASRIAELSGVQLSANNGDVINYLKTALPGLGQQQIVLDTGALVGQTVKQYDAALGKLYTQDVRRV